MCMVDELIVPPEIAKNLSYPVRVNNLNMEYCKKLIEENKVNYIRRDGNLLSTKIILWTQGFKLKPGDKVIRNTNIIDPSKVSLIKQTEFKILPGDKVIRTVPVFNSGNPGNYPGNPGPYPGNPGPYPGNTGPYPGNRSNNENENKEVLEYKTIVIDNVYDKLPKRKKFEIKY